MKTLYLECNMGAAGDMLTAALLELHPDPAGFVRRLNALGLPKVEFRSAPAVKCGITGTQMAVLVDGAEEGRAQGHHHGGHGHHGMHDIAHIVSHLDLPKPVRDDVLAVYGLIAEAESQVHGKPVTEIHFHEVGALDAVADVTAVCLLMHELAPGRILASPVHVGSGQVRCAHGVLPVPAPATALLLRGIPTYGGEVRGELCTPTGAALLRHFVQSFGAQPVMCVEKIGYGFGKKDFERANCVRAMLGETDGGQECVIELCCNLDDMTPEAVGFAMERLLEAGALDVYTVPVGMKKNRPGVLLTCMCRAGQREEMIRLLFLHTTTLGLRETVCRRYTLARSMDVAESPFGQIRIKRASGWGVAREKAEYEDLARIAREQNVSLQQVQRAVFAPGRLEGGGDKS
ncbi:nickel pincer cofactor biosynthesis protein LarC [Intestinibacillus massiliensis]|uniref:nickel pincer cofactor biosynthesis protein LarC n=1 Tax=Intestinibacillus massiliensis TaxID=1871029 RepID=UPI000B3636D2|nr:nickel pincer cofactor biosynthesis protein LarC [Intestinibacillus massiliensis]